MKTNLRKAIVVIPFAMTMIVPSVTPILANDGTEPQVVQETNYNYEYHVAFDANGVNANNMPDPMDGLTTGTIALPEAPTADGYTFVGWSTASNPDTTKDQIYQANAYIAAPTEQTTFYAIWKTADQKTEPTTDTYKFVINYNASDIAANNMPDQQSGSTNETDNMVSLSDKTPTAAGFTFLGWSATQYGTTVDYAPGATIGIDKDTTLNLYAVWKKDTPKQQATEINYNIYFNSNIKVEKGMPERMSGVLQENQGNKVTLPTMTPVATGYTFVGWTTDKNGTKVEYKAGDAVEFKTGTSEVQNVQLYALWQKADDTSKASTVQTGTETNLGIYAGVTGVAAALLAAIGLKKKFNK